MTFQSSKELYLRGVINIRIARRLHFPILKGTLSSRSDTSCGIMVSAFQSSKELYLPNHQKQQLHDRALSNPQRNFIFKKRSGTRKSKRDLSNPQRNFIFTSGRDPEVSSCWPFQSSKELYLPRIAPIHGLLLSSFQSSKELYLLCQLCHPALTVLLSNPQRNFIFPQKHSHSNNFHGSPLAFTFDIGIRQNTTTLGSQQLI